MFALSGILPTVSEGEYLHVHVGNSAISIGLGIYRINNTS